MQFKRSLTVVVTAVFLTSSMTMASAVTSKGSRVLAMDVGPGENETLANALDEAQSIGVTTIPVSVSWADIEPDYLDYQDPDNLFADLIDELDGRGMSVILNLRPIAGACRTLPEDLEARFELPTSDPDHLDWDDAETQLRFEYLLDAVDILADGLTIEQMTIGTEIDSHLDSATEYAAYKSFFEEARSDAQADFGSIPVGVATTWFALTAGDSESDWLLDLNENADRVMFTYYGIGGSPLSAKHPYNGPTADIYDAILAIDGATETYGKDIDLIEVGYPSSTAIGGSEANQDVFVSTMFGIWDTYYPRINTMVFNWQTDLTEQGSQWVSAGSWGGGSCPEAGGSAPDAPTAPTVTPQGTTGSTTWSYWIIAVNDHGQSYPGATGTTTTGNATLSGSNFNQISWSAVTGADSYLVMRQDVGSGENPGLIGTTTGTSFDDTGLDSTTWELAEFLRSIGFREFPDPVTNKDAWDELDYQAGLRGW